jgi:drug/metabolite transporter (DMT)-like permease
MVVWLLVTVRVLANPLSNVFQKVLTRRGADPLFVIVVTHALLAVPCLPALAVALKDVRPGFWAPLLVSAALAVAGNTLLVAALRIADLSVVGPINAYKAVVSLVPAIVLLGEFPGPLGLAGMGLIIAGSYFVVDKDVSRPRANAFVRFFSDRGVQLRFAALVVSATEAAFLKKALLTSSPLATFSAWAVLGLILSLVAAVVSSRGRWKQQSVIARDSARTYLSLALTTGLMQFCTIAAFGTLKVGYALALFQTSTLVSVILGHKLFQERHVAERLAGASVMAAGAAMIVLGR